MFARDKVLSRAWVDWLCCMSHKRSFRISCFCIVYFYFPFCHLAYSCCWSSMQACSGVS